MGVKNMRVGIIGCGNAGKDHLSAYNQLGIETAIYDSNDKLARETANIYSSNQMELGELLSRSDVIDITTPTYTHAQVIKKVVSAKKDIILETPLARTVEEAQDIINVCQRGGIKLFPVLSYGCAGPLSKALELSKRVSRISVARISRRYKGVPFSYESWKGDIEKSGGVILETLYHDIAFLLRLLGPVERVFASTTAYTNPMDGEEYALVSLGFSNGSIAHLDGCWLSTQKSGDEMEFAYPGGLVTYSDLLSSPVRISTSDGVSIQSPLLYTPLTAFIKQVFEGLKPECNRALEAMKVACAALASAKNRETVRVERGDIAI